MSENEPVKPEAVPQPAPAPTPEPMPAHAEPQPAPAAPQPAPWPPEATQAAPQPAPWPPQAAPWPPQPDAAATAAAAQPFAPAFPPPFTPPPFPAQPFQAQPQPQAVPQPAPQPVAQPAPQAAPQPAASFQQTGPLPQPPMPGQAFDQTGPMFQPPMPGQPYGAPGYGMPGQPAAQPPKKKKTGLIILICVLVVLLIGGGGGAYWYFAMRDDPSKPVTAGQAKFPQAAVRGYLQALAVGSSSDALSFVEQTPNEMTMLTDQVLDASIAVYPVTDIVATKDNTLSTKDTAVVDATFNVGSTSFSMQYQVDQVGKYYFIQDPFVTTDLSGLLVSGVDITVNGVSMSDIVDTSDVSLFPGVYTMAINNNPLLTITSDTTFTADSGMSLGPVIGLGLSPDAQGQFATAAEDALTSCMKEDATHTSCGFGAILYRDIDTKKLITPKPGIKWSFPGAKPNFSAQTFMWDQDEPTTATAYMTIKVRIDFSSTDGGVYRDDRTLTAVNIDFSDPSNLSVTFDE